MATRSDLSFIQRMHAGLQMRWRLFRWSFVDTATMEQIARDRVWDFERAVEQRRFGLTLDLAEKFFPSPWMNVLEAGCADGAFTALIAPRCDKLKAVDVAPTACERAQARVRTFQNVTVSTMNIASDELPKDTYDVVFALDVLDHIPPQRKMRRAALNLIASTKPGGMLAISCCRYPFENEWWARTVLGSSSVFEAFVSNPDVVLLGSQSQAADPLNDYNEKAIWIFRKRDATERPQ